MFHKINDKIRLGLIHGQANFARKFLFACFDSLRFSLVYSNIAFANAVMNLRVPLNAGNSLTS
jgi:hypothetical protein